MPEFDPVKVQQVITDAQEWNELSTKAVREITDERATPATSRFSSVPAATVFANYLLQKQAVYVATLKAVQKDIENTLAALDESHTIMVTNDADAAARLQQISLTPTGGYQSTTVRDRTRDEQAEQHGYHQQTPAGPAGGQSNAPNTAAGGTQSAPGQGAPGGTAPATAAGTPSTQSAAPAPTAPEGQTSAQANQNPYAANDPTP
ncbi:MAG: hypothetical protein LWW86_07670 [Micrococcales bacterium]|nr:hypothetical protein [Micrococcales bacterium]